ncbi:CIA30-domain-containing protein [Saccharata proteae CBS 121410]|uniref:CIA30-domain-containing protein n=1 Tax=Saccharata proteae CBS 121410 TaxID=1314787 RepID=A0A9P4HZW3_9PEZI|nr:CIA30-domain-containing protein [Saccharata proteae CBS 121410]
MRCSAPLRAGGFWKRSYDEVKRFGQIAWNLEALEVPTRPYPLITFSEPSSIGDCKSMSDKDIGGFSHAHLDFVPEGEGEGAHARFHGSISTDVPANLPHVQRSGYAGWRTLDRKRTLFGKSLWDIDPYRYLAMTIRSDGRKYFVNVQTESIVPTDLHQHRLYPRKIGEWETILIDWNDFVRTNHGMLVEPQKEMLRQRVKSVGISLTDGQPGPFELSVSRIWASNGLDKEGGESAVLQEEEDSQGGGILRDYRAKTGSKKEG